MGFLQTLTTIGQTLINHTNFVSLLEMDRDLACQQLGERVEQSTPAQLDAFEQAFLTHSISVVGGKYRLRATELYAYLKIKEMAHYQGFRGFVGPCGPL